LYLWKIGDLSLRLLIGIPTIESGPYISDSLMRVKGEIDLCPNDWDIIIVLCINGEDHNNETVIAVRQFFKRFTYLKGFVITERHEGKNKAINRIVKFANKINHVDIVHFFDDDVYLQAGSLSVNVKCLLEMEETNHKPILVGSSFVGIKHTFSFFTGKYRLFDAIRKWLFHIIIIQPYLLQAEKPLFCEGPSCGTFLKYMPILPDDSLGITDDCFLSNYFAVRGKDDFLQHGIYPTIKPTNSVAYVEMAIKYKDWKSQQIRIHAGIERAFNYFSEERAFLEKYFSWSYAFNIKSRKRPSSKPLRRFFLYYIYMLLHENNRKTAEVMIKNGIVPSWATVSSTKTLFVSEETL